nr:MAG TPA: hypothetical protein [Caudoviricetes sp.]
MYKYVNTFFNIFYFFLIIDKIIISSNKKRRGSIKSTPLFYLISSSKSFSFNFSGFISFGSASLELHLSPLHCSSAILSFSGIGKPSLLAFSITDKNSVAT